MTYRATVRNGVLILPPEISLEEGAEVEISLRPVGTALGSLLDHAGTWHGDDAEDVVEFIYRSRSGREMPVFPER